MDGSTILLLGLAAIVLLIALVTGVGLLRGPAALYVRRDALLSQNEVMLLRGLESSVGEDFRVMTKVGIDGLVQLKARLPRKARRHATNRIRGDLFDYVLLDRTSLSPVAALVIETGDMPRRQRRHHAFLRKLCKAIGLPLIFIDPATGVNPEHLRRTIEDAMRPAAETEPAVARREPSIVTNHASG